MANPLTAGTARGSVQFTISGATIAPQGTAPTSTITTPTADVVGSGQFSFAYGTGAGQCDILCAADYQLTAGASVTLDIYANGLPNVFGGDANFRKIKGVFVGILSGGDTAGVAVGGAASNANALFFADASDKALTFPGYSPFMQSGPGTTVDATHRNVKVENLGAVTVTVRVMLAGTSV